jgi:hypothetical protein
MNDFVTLSCPAELQFLRPVIVEDLCRVGNLSDGGYAITLSAIERCNHFISLGLGENWSFEKSVSKLKPNATMDIFDHTVSLTFFARKALKGLIKFLLLQDSKENLLGRFSRLSNYYFFWFKNDKNNHHRIKITRDSLEEVLSNYPTAAVLGLKIDIEGSEWEILDLIVENQARFEFVLIEVHEFDRHADQLKFFLNVLSDSFVIAHLHANNFENLGSNGFPSVFEITLLRSPGATNLAGYRSELPIPGLDVSNAKNRPDFLIKF